MKYFRIYRETLKNEFAFLVAYRGNFIVESIISILSNMVLPLVTLLIYNNGASFEGWNMYEVLLIQSIFIMASGISSIFFIGIVWSTMNHIRAGTLETVLLKPVNCLFYLLASTVNLSSISILLGGIVLFVVSMGHIETPDIGMWIQSGFFFVAGLFVMLGIRLLMAATTFRWVGNSRIPEMFDSVTRFGNYPRSIFSKEINHLTAMIIPVAMIAAFPTEALLGRGDKTMYIALIPCMIFFVLGILLYQYMVRLYEGVGG